MLTISLSQSVSQWVSEQHHFYRVTQKKRSLAICALVDPTWHSRMIHRVEYQSKTLSNILSWLITLLFNLIAHSNTILASPGTLNEVEVPSKQPQAGASAFEPRLQNRASNEHFFVQKSAQYLHKILNVCIKVCIKTRPKKHVNATKLMSRQKRVTTT